MKIKGLSRKDIIELGNWYAYHNDIVKVKEKLVPVGSYKNGLNNLAVRISKKPINNHYTRTLGYIHFQNMIRECHDFGKVIVLECIEDADTIWNRKYKSVDINGEEVTMSFFHGDLIDFPPIVKIECKNQEEDLYYYFDHSKKYVREIEPEKAM